MNPWKAEGILVKQLKPSLCVVPDKLRQHCKGKIVNAHTISKSANLQKIAVDGHVYAFDTSMKTLMENQGKPAPKLTGVNKASTFTGFCAHHDKTIFEEVEDQEMIFSDAQCFKLAYRAVGRETYLKHNSVGLESLARSSDKGRPLSVQHAIQSFADSYFRGVVLGASGATRQQDIYNEVLISGDYSKVRKLVLRFERMPTVMASGGIFPEFDFEGRRLQRIGIDNRPLEMITFNVIATTTGGAFVFAWIQSSDGVACDALAQSLSEIPADRVTSAIIRFLFEYCENTFMAPEWWEALPTPVRAALVRRMTFAGSVFEERLSSCLKDDNFSYGDWGLIKVTH